MDRPGHERQASQIQGVDGMRKSTDIEKDESEDLQREFLAGRRRLVESLGDFQFSAPGYQTLQETSPKDLVVELFRRVCGWFSLKR